MKTVLLLALLATATTNVQAQPVTASTDLLEFAPSLVPGESSWESVVFTNQTGEAIVVHGLGWNGPFAFDWECSGGDSGELPPDGTCVLSGRFVPPADQPLGVADGLVGFRVATGTVIVDLRGFAYTTQPVAGVRNLRASLEPLSVDPLLIPWLWMRLDAAEAALLDGHSGNDRQACGQLQAFIRRVIHEAARDRLPEWNAAALGVQEAAISQSVGCGPFAAL